MSLPSRFPSQAQRATAFKQRLAVMGLMLALSCGLPATAASQAEPAATQPGDSTAQAGVAVILPRALPRTEAAKLLEAGDFAQALGILQDHPPTPGALPQWHFLRGLATLALAERTAQQEIYLDAGLDFMRVAVYFPNSPLLGPALVEVGYVHQKIGRSDIAQRLYQRAQALIDPAQEPGYHHRLGRLMEQLPQQ